MRHIKNALLETKSGVALRRFNVIALFELDHPGISFIDGHVQAIYTEGFPSFQRIVAERIRICDRVRFNLPIFDFDMAVRDRVGVGIVSLCGEKTLDKGIDDVDGQVGNIEYGVQTNAESVVMMQRPAFVDLDHCTISDVWNLLFDPFAP